MLTNSIHGWTARCHCYSGHNSSSGRCHHSPADGHYYCEECVMECGVLEDQSFCPWCGEMRLKKEGDTLETKASCTHCKNLYTIKDAPVTVEESILQLGRDHPMSEDDSTRLLTKIVNKLKRSDGLRGSDMDRPTSEIVAQIVQRKKVK